MTAVPPPPGPESPLGRRMVRNEDRRLLLGRGRFVADLPDPPGTLHAVFVRSPHAHARILGIDSSAVNGATVLTGADLARHVAPLRLAPPIAGLHPVEMPVLPLDHVRFVGDPVALVLAPTRTASEDAAELVQVDYAPLPAVASVADARADVARVDASLPSNRVSHQRYATPALEASFAAAERVVEARFSQHRQTHVPLEPRGMLALWDAGREHLTMRCGTQAPHPYRTAMAARLGLAEHQVTIDSPEMGGGFGQKIIPLREDLCCAAAARLLDAPVRWQETRGENLIAGLHAREDVVTARAAVTAQGDMLALQFHIQQDFGAWCFFPANYMARMMALVLPGPYRVKELGYEVEVFLTHKCPSGPMRAPMAIASWVTEGLMDEIARELALDPLELRRRNTIGLGDQPWINAMGERYDALTVRETLEAATAALDYAAARAMQRDDKRLLGLGLCTVVETTTYGSAFYKASGIPGSGHETASLRIEPSGAVLTSCGLMGSGQGYETTLAQAAAGGLGCRVQDVKVQLGNSDTAPYGMGSRGARGATAGGGATYIAGLRLKAKVLEIAARMLGRNDMEGLDLHEGQVLLHGAPAGVTLPEVARLAYLDPLRLPPGMQPGLHEVYAFDPPPLTFANSTHACLVEIEPETGTPRILRYVVAEDSGTRINPLVVEGQTHGATAMGISGVLLEHAAYDADGQALAGSLMDYAIARADDLPAFQLVHCDMPTPRTPAGIKGMSEGGVMGAIGAVMNAVNDALAQRGTRLDGQPASAPRIWAALQAGKH